MKMVLKAGLMYEKTSGKLITPAKKWSRAPMIRTSLSITGQFVILMEAMYQDPDCDYVKTPERRDALVAEHMERMVKQNHTGNHYRNHTVRVSAPMCRTTMR